MTFEWRDAGSEVRVTLVTGPLGAGGAGRVQFSCSERRVQLKLPDGRSWSSRLFAAVLPDGSDFQPRPGGRLLIQLLKHDPGLAWTSLEVRRGLLVELLSERTGWGRGRGDVGDATIWDGVTMAPSQQKRNALMGYIPNTLLESRSWSRFGTAG